MSVERMPEHEDPAAAGNEAATDPVTGSVRRVPTQQRSRRRVEAILDAAERLVLADGVEALTTRAIATQAGVPVASLYQYFADKEAVLLALAARDMEEMDAQVLGDLGRLEVLSVSSVVRTTMMAFVAVYHRRRAFVEIYLRGRTNAAVHQFGREHNARVAESLYAFAADAGIDARLPRVDVRLRVDGKRLRAGARAWSQSGRSPVEAVVDFDRDSGDGRAWFGLKRADLSAWAPLLRGGPLSKDAVSRLVGRLADDFETWRQRNLAEDEIQYLLMDGWYPKVRIGKRRVRVPVLVTLGVRADGERVVLEEAAA